jgi:hypothetical protein
MRLIARLVAWLSRYLRRIGVCGNAGVIVGLLAGGAIALLDLLKHPLVLSNPEAVRTWVILALLGWLVLIVVFVGFVRWSLASVVVPTLVNAVLVSGITLYLSRALGLFPWAWLLGLVVGMVLGLLLCRLYRYSVKGGAR